MYLLAIETSTLQFSIALAKDNTILAEYTASTHERGSEGLVPAIERLFEQTKLSLDTLNAYAISQGPGSFTGLRVGYSVVKGLCMVEDRPVYGLSTLDVIAHKAIDYPKTLCVIQDAKQKRLYVSQYHVTKNKTMRRTLRPQIMTIDQILPMIQGTVHFLGDGISLYKETIIQTPHIDPIFLTKDLWIPKATTVAHCAYNKTKTTKGKNAARIRPGYLYTKDYTYKIWKTENM